MSDDWKISEEVGKTWIGENTKKKDELARGEIDERKRWFDGLIVEIDSNEYENSLKRFFERIN